MFNRTILAFRGASHQLPNSALLSALLLVTAAPVAQAANADASTHNGVNTNVASVNNKVSTTKASTNKTSNDWATQSINPSAYCDSYIKKQSQTTRLSQPQNMQSSQLTMDCMLTQLHIYQQNDKSVREQYLAYKAQAWLNYAYNENSIKSQTAAGSHALQMASTILQALKSNTAEQVSLTTNIPATSALMRPDLWATLNALKDSDGIRAAPREVAYSEVALIWAAAEQCNHGWRKSGAHFRMADRWLEQAREAYVNSHDSATNVALEELINRYFKQYAPLDSGEDVCHGQVLPTTIEKPPSTQTLHTEIQRSFTTAQQTTTAIPMPTPTATYRVGY